MSWAERSTGIIPVRAHVRPDRQHRRPTSPDIDEQIEARLAPYMWKTMLDTRVRIAEDLGAAPEPLVLAQLEC